MSFPEQPFGFVAGRWVRSIGDTPDDADRAPDYVPVKDGAVVFTPQVSHRVAADGSGWAGIIKDRVSARVGERGQLIDAEGHDHLALAVGVYSVSYDFGLDRSWPSHYIEVKQEHTADSPLWLPPIVPPAEGPMIENRVVTIPADGADGQVLVWDGGGFSWMDAPKGDKGDQGDITQLAGAPRLTNLVHDITWDAIDSTIESQTPRLAKFTATAQHGYIRRGSSMLGGKSHYFTAEVKATSDKVFLGSSQNAVYHSGSGDWERLTGVVARDSNQVFVVRDTRPSGWDQIEVRDPVLINLTEVFGAGREPTKEYMDALLANHDNYIGALDQFAFGDALHALTLAGQGMSVRVDNSVGTRVFLDHPGGSTMLYGDTGWRDMSSYLPLGATGTFLARRTLHATDVKINVTLTADWERIGDRKTLVANLIRDLPLSMFPFDSYNIAPLLMREGTTGAPDGTVIIGYQSQTASRLSITSSRGTNWEVGTVIKISGALPNDQPWPDTPFGTPA